MRLWWRLTEALPLNEFLFLIFLQNRDTDLQATIYLPTGQDLAELLITQGFARKFEPVLLQEPGEQIDALQNDVR